MKMPRISLLILTLLLGSLTCRAAERALALTDKELYMTGERLHISVCILDDDMRPSTLSRVAYVEISDTYRLCAQGMVSLEHGRGWADIPLPASMHSGNYLLTVYTRAMRNLDLTTDPALFTKVISVVNPSHVSRADNIVFLPTDSIVQSPIYAEASSLEVDAQGNVTLPASYGDDLLLSTLSVMREDLVAPDCSTLQPTLRMLTTSSNGSMILPEVEGHLVLARPTDQKSIISQTRLVMIGRQNAIYDGQWQADGSWLYYTTNLYGKRPAMLSAYDTEGQPVHMDFVSPFAKILPLALPKLSVGCTEADLQRRAESAQHEQDITDWLANDSISFNPKLLSGEPRFSYDLDEYTKFKSVREILIEFVRGVKRSKVHGVNQLFTIDPDLNMDFKWSALVLLDGMPIFNIDDILDYDARLLKYVQIYTDRYTFGSTTYGGIISFTSQKGRLSNFNIDRVNQLVSYSFPQDHPDFIVPAEAQAGTVFWNPDVVDTKDDSMSFSAPSAPGNYRILLQSFDKAGKYVLKAFLLKIEAK